MLEKPDARTGKIDWADHASMFCTIENIAPRPVQWDKLILPGVVKIIITVVQILPR
jgi:hypothetical protein